MRKVCIVTGSRAEFGLLYWLIKAIHEDKDLKLQIVVTGMHLSPEFGLTYKEIEKEFKIDKKIEILLSSDTSIGISKSMGLAQISFAEVFDELLPDVVLVLGDRYEIFAASAAAMIAKIPIAHIHGGEATEGLVDESIRHSVTKMSHLHFTATKEYRRRVIQLGEDPSRVFCVGGLGIENIKRLRLLTKSELEKEIKFKFGKKNALVTFHPVTLEKSTAESQFKSILDALEQVEDLNVIFTKSNSDTDGRIINLMIDEYVKMNPDSCVAYTSLGSLRYLSSLQFVDFVLGNSSSGLLEVPTFKIPTVNIGDRQKGRIRAESVLDCSPSTNEILKVIDQLYSEPFQKQLASTSNPYGEGNSSQKIVKKLKEFDWKNILKKSFYDLRNDS